MTKYPITLLRNMDDLSCHLIYDGVLSCHLSLDVDLSSHLRYDDDLLLLLVGEEGLRLQLANPESGRVLGDLLRRRRRLTGPGSLTHVKAAACSRRGDWW